MPVLSQGIYPYQVLEQGLTRLYQIILKWDFNVSPPIANMALSLHTKTKNIFIIIIYI